ncbi:MAG: alkaline phosphatase PhoX [bacterium]
MLRWAGVLTGGALAGGVLTGGVLTLLAAPRLQAKKSIVTLLEPPDGHGLRLWPGLRARVVARSGEFPPGTSGYRWHEAPDGGAVFPAPDGDGDSAKGGGWVYVSNSESRRGKAGAGALRFDAGGNLVSAYPILTGTERNCAGGATPWGTWLSCEEHSRGRVWECDPFGQNPAVARPALGVFAHEAAAVDPVRGEVYLTEDIPDGLLYRFTPTRRGDLSQGRLEGAFVKRGSMEVRWIPVPDPLAKTRPTRRQLSRGTIFNRSEGIVHYQGRIVFATTGDHRLWSYDIAARKISVLYDARRHPNPPVTSPDNLAVSRGGTLLIAEDGGELKIVARTPEGVFRPIVQLAGHPRSEPAGQALDPSGTRLYFSSQRGAAGRRSQGITYEISGLKLG